MRVALDYDGTYTLDPKLWDTFIALFEANNHTVCIVTFRDERYDRTDLLDKLSTYIPVYYTRGVAKKWWYEQFGTGDVDVWIDDTPEALLHNSAFPKDKLEEWREDNKRIDVA